MIIVHKLPKNVVQSVPGFWLSSSCIYRLIYQDLDGNYKFERYSLKEVSQLTVKLTEYGKTLAESFQSVHSDSKDVS